MLTLNSIQSAATYPGLGDTGRCTLGPVTPGIGNAGMLNVQVYRASVYVQLYVLDDPDLSPRGYHPTNEILMAATSTQSQIRSWQGVVGFTARDAVAGTHGTLIADLSEPADPIGAVGVPIGSGGNQIGGGMLTGWVNADGSIRAGTGFEVQSVSFGSPTEYVIHFTPELTTAPDVVATPGGNNVLWINQISSGHLHVKIDNVAGDSFTFLVTPFV